MSERAVIVYWGPGLSGKSTNLSVVREVLSGSSAGGEDGVEAGHDSEGDLDRSLFELGGKGEEGLRLELLAPPGQPHHRHLRQEAFAGVDGIVFVADSSAGAVAANLAALDELELFVAAQHKELAELSLVFQYNKRDLRDALEVPRLDEMLNPSGRPSVEAIATRGVGVFPSLKAVIADFRERPPQIEDENARRLEEPGGAGGRNRLKSDWRGDEDQAEDSIPLSTDSGLQCREDNHPPVSKVGGTRWLLALAALGGALGRECMELIWMFAGADR